MISNTSAEEYIAPDSTTRAKTLRYLNEGSLKWEPSCLARDLNGVTPVSHNADIKNTYHILKAIRDVTMTFVARDRLNKAPFQPAKLGLKTLLVFFAWANLIPWPKPQT